jgi:phosphopantothenoylcysteine synthetase/decarboxylase
MKKIKVLITSGPTREYIDPVRYISNASSGKMGCELSRAALKKGCDVTVVTGPVDIEYPAGVRVLKVVTALDMLKKVKKIFKNCDVMIGAAAVSDYRPSLVKKQKIKKSGKGLVVRLVENPDIIGWAGRNKNERIVAGFALESSDIAKNARKKIEEKHLNFIVANAPGVIGKDRTSIELIRQDGSSVVLKNTDKRIAAERIINEALSAF